jgi:hypothetical protein
LKLRAKDSRFLGWALVYFLPYGAAFPQEIPTLQLKNTEVRPLRNLGDEPILDPVRCDGSGNIYLRTYQYPDPLAAPVRRFTQEGKRLPDLSLVQSDAFKDMRYQIKDFQTGLAGHTFVLVVSTKKNEEGEDFGPVEVSVVNFDEDGKPRTRTKLDTPPEFNAGQLGVFPDGKFVVGGSKAVRRQGYVPQKGEPPPRDLYIASFDQSGHLLVEFHPTPPPVAEASAEAPDSTKVPQVSPKKKQSSASEVSAPNDMVVGQDGNAYFFHKTSPPMVYVISENGEFTRQFYIQLPSSKAKPWWIRALPGLKLLVNFIEDEGADRSSGQIRYFYVVDSQSGATLLRYKTLSTDGGIFACYSEPYDFVFLGGDPQGFTTIVHTAPK